MRANVIIPLCVMLMITALVVTPVFANEYSCCNFGYQQYYTQFDFVNSNGTAVKNETVTIQIIVQTYPNWFYSTLGYPMVERTNETFNLTTDSNGYTILPVDRAMLHKITCRNTTVLLYPFESEYIIWVGD